MTTGLESFVKIAPPIWRDGTVQVQPGDLSLFAPMGNGLGAPMVFMPWDDLASVNTRQGYYAFHPHTGHPISGAPITEPGGGTVYFGGDCQRADIEALLHLLGVHTHLKDYAAFVKDATNPLEDRFLTQMRLISGAALRFLFRVQDGPQLMELTEQPLTIGEVLLRFIEHHQQQYAAGTYALEGAMGGDGDWAKERLAFGLMVENEYHAIYRIWTRAWLITK